MITTEQKPAKTTSATPKSANWKFGVVGIFFGIVFVKAEIISWFRIQEMFRLDSFHMYGVIGTAVIVGMMSIWLIKRLNIKTVQGDSITIAPKKIQSGADFMGACYLGLGGLLRAHVRGRCLPRLGRAILSCWLLC